MRQGTVKTNPATMKYDGPAQESSVPPDLNENIQNSFPSQTSITLNNALALPTIWKPLYEPLFCPPKSLDTQRKRHWLDFHHECKYSQ